MQLQSTLPKRVETRINKKGRLPVKLQSTLPKRVETYEKYHIAYQNKHFNPLYPNGQRPIITVLAIRLDILQSTLPKRVETRIRLYPVTYLILQSTLPKRVETNQKLFFVTMHSNFNPLYPNGQRRGLHGAIDKYHGTSIHSTQTGRDCKCRYIYI